MMDTVCLHQDIIENQTLSCTSTCVARFLKKGRYICLCGSQYSLLYLYYRILTFRSVGCRSVRVYFTRLHHCPLHPTRDTQPAVTLSMEVHQCSPKSQLPCQQICQDSSKKNFDLETLGWILWFFFFKISFRICILYCIYKLLCWYIICLSIYIREQRLEQDFKLKKLTVNLSLRGKYRYFLNMKPMKAFM